MYKLIFLSLLLVSICQAQSENTSIGRTDRRFEAISAADLRERFVLNEEIFVTDKDGRLLDQSHEQRTWKFGKKGDLVANWSFQSPDIKELALGQTWSIADDGKITAHIQQFSSLKRGQKEGQVILGQLLREEKIEVKDFAPINWLAYADDKQRVTVRLTPHLAEKKELLQIDGLPITLENLLIYDNQGKVWAQGGSVDGRFITLKTHMGWLALSYSKFSGASELGTAANDEIILHPNSSLTIYVRSQNPVLIGKTPAKVYGLIDLNKKSDRTGSLSMSSSNEEKHFVKSMDER